MRGLQRGEVKRTMGVGDDVSERAPQLSTSGATHRRVLLALGVLALASTADVAWGQAARRSSTGAAAADTGTVTYVTGGVRVIQRQTSGDIAVANLYLLGGVRQVTWQNAGIEPLLLEATERGTRAYSKDRLRRAMSRLGTGIVTDAEPDWTVFGIRATRTTFDSTWAIFASRLMQPTLDSGEVELIRQQFLLGVSQRQDSPDALLEYLADSVGFAGHPYAVPVAGTAESLARISLGDLRQYHAEQFVTSRMLLVVVGDITRDKVERLVGQTLARMPAGSYQWTLPDSLPRSTTAPFTVNRQVPTNYIMGRFAGPRAGTKDYYALRITAAVLAGQLFGEIRSRRNLTYAVDAPFVDRAIAAGGFYVTTVQPELTVDLMRQQLTALRTGMINDEALARLVQQFLTQFYLDNETNANQADFLARSFLFEGDIRAVARFEEQLRSVTPQDIQRAAQRYVRDVRWVYVGDEGKVPSRAFSKF
ncbi:MAG: insulinase family protein [Gemmatimonadetes bacterium]|nr:insulinase family protein [Gemmatimonadota bacterium]